ncbi:OprO/OprP family phosphate-selective porin [Urbifossiella limnaea]|uniref:Porin P n=1 Tax=Urbifossiella limnaea TaxID=2528023 RepID=A0A517Y2A2_9BACT|nr:porin [Urbifossiella limnaea]QDU23903.1 Porin P precursor [Urbifossiella limnaea]
MTRAALHALLAVLTGVGTVRAEPPPEPPASPVAARPPEAEDPPAADRLAGLLDLKPTIQMRGRVEADAVLASQSEQSKATLGDLMNGYGFRRVRLGAQGTVGDSTSWVSEVELAGGNVRLRDVFVGLDAIPGVRQVRIGHFREPYSLEGMTSSNFITFLERAPQNVLAPARNWGVCGFWWPDDERVLFSVGAFRDGTPSNGQSLGDDGNWAVTTRLTGLPVYEPDEDAFRLVHLGGAFSQRVPPNGVINFTPRTGSNLLSVDDNPGSPFLAPVDIPANGYQLYNLQAAGVWGSFSAQAEWSAAGVQQTDAGSVFVHGSYLAVSYFTTGEHRGYNRTRGSFDQVGVRRPLIRSRTDPRGGWGAVELVARFAYLDFTSPNLPPDANGFPAATRLYEFTTGANWYLNSYTRVMLNYTAGIPYPVGAPSTVAHIFGVRYALFF